MLSIRAGRLPFATALIPSSGLGERPKAPRTDVRGQRKCYPPRAPITAEEEDEIADRVVAHMAELGLFGFRIPQEYGGQGLSVVGQCVANEKLSRTNAWFRTRIETNNGIGSMGILLEGASEILRMIVAREMMR